MNFFKKETEKKVSFYNYDLNRSGFNFTSDCFDNINQVILYDKKEITPILFCFKFNKEKDLKLSHEQLDYLIKNSDLKKYNHNNGWSPLVFALSNNKLENLNLSLEQWDYLIKNSDLKQVSKQGNTILKYALTYYKEQNLNFNQEHWDLILTSSPS